MATLAFDLGGTKIQAATVAGGRVLARERCPTPRDAGPDAWLDAMADLAGRLGGGKGELKGSEPFSKEKRALTPLILAVCVTGILRDGCWHALNPDTLPVPDGFPLRDALAERFGVAPVLLNDAHAAAWGEYRHGGHGAVDSLYFVTVSTGVGGGFVSGGRLMAGATGQAASLGNLPLPGGPPPVRLETGASGTALAALAKARGTDAAAISAGAAAGDPEAVAALEAITGELAWGLAAVRMLLDPALVVVSGGLGLAPGFLERLRTAVDRWPPDYRVRLSPAGLGADAGVIGVADWAEGSAP